MSSKNEAAELVLFLGFLAMLGVVAGISGVAAHSLGLDGPFYTGIAGLVGAQAVGGLVEWMKSNR